MLFIGRGRRWFFVRLMIISRIIISLFPPLTRIINILPADPLCLIVTSSTRSTHPFPDRSMSRWNHLEPTLRDHSGGLRSAIVKLNRMRLRCPWLSMSGISMCDAPGRLHPAVVVSHYSHIRFSINSINHRRALQTLSYSFLQLAEWFKKEVREYSHFNLI